MSKLWVGFLSVIALTGLIDTEANGVLNNDASYLFIFDLAYVYENVDFNYIDIYDSGDGSKIADIYGGFIGTLGAACSSTVNLYAGSVGNLFADGTSTVNIYDSLVYNVDAHQLGSVNIFGGFFENFVRTSDYSQVTIFGGTFADELRATENSIMTIYGSDFSIDGVPVAYGQITVLSGILAGTLANGKTINNDFYIYDDATIVLVPEPATVLLFGLGGLVLLKKRRA